MNEPEEGYIVEVCEGCAWLAKDGTVTSNWDEHGIWKTPEEAREALLVSQFAGQATDEN